MEDVPERAARSVVVVLAAGRSERMRGANKLILEFEGVPIVARVVDAALASTAADVVVVTGNAAESVVAALGARLVHIVHNAGCAAGLGTSIARGVAALPADATCALICLGDLPRLRAEHFDALIRAYDPTRGRTLCVPVHEGRRGHPVLFGAQYFDELRVLDADTGAREILSRHPDSIYEIQMDDPAITLDIDTPEDWQALVGAST
jgi:molybdenum cofactor cytidylyltransferase